MELGATGDMLSSTRKRNLMLMKRVKYENKINCVLEDQLNKKTTRLTALSQYKHDNEAKHQEVLKNEIALRQQATWDAAEAKKQMEAMQKQLDIAEKRLSHHMEQETIRLKEEEIARDLKNKLKARNLKKMVALESLEKALHISHTFDTGKKIKRKKSSLSNAPPKAGDTALVSDTGGQKGTTPDGHITSNAHAMEQIGKLRVAITSKGTKFGTKLGILNDLFSALDVNGNGAVIKEDFLFAMERVGLKSNKQSSLNALVDALDVDGDGDVSFVELCDGLMRRMQQAKEKHADDMRRQRERREKAAKKKKR